MPQDSKKKQSQVTPNAGTLSPELWQSVIANTPQQTMQGMPLAERVAGGQAHLDRFNPTPVFYGPPAPDYRPDPRGYPIERVATPGGNLYPEGSMYDSATYEQVMQAPPQFRTQMEGPQYYLPGGKGVGGMAVNVTSGGVPVYQLRPAEDQFMTQQFTPIDESKIQAYLDMVSRNIPEGRSQRRF